MLLLLALAAHAADPVACTAPAAQAAYSAGYAAQKARKPDEAMSAWTTCIAAEPGCTACWWEKGWTHWARDEWDPSIASWQQVLAQDPAWPEATKWLDAAQKRKSTFDSLPKPPPIGTTATGGGVTLTLVAKFQGYKPATDSPKDVFDPAIYSPKSVRFLTDGSKAYVNSLEGFTTVVYDANKLVKLGEIPHRFTAADKGLFSAPSAPFDYAWTHTAPGGNPDVFSGKPVESELSHKDRWLWVPYYRRDFDSNGTSPSAVSIIDTRTDKIVRVIATGPIPKYVAVSPDDSRVAISHWGDNTVMMIDTSSGDPATFKVLPKLMVVEKQLPLSGVGEVDRDAACGSCLRGTVFSPDGKTLLVARMGDGGIAGFDTATGAYLGTITGVKPTPRHLVVSLDKKWLYLSSNSSGYVSRIGLDAAIAGLRGANGAKVPLAGWEGVDVGTGARTIEITDDGRWVFVALNNTAELAVVDTRSMTVATRIRVDPYTVGLDISPEGHRVWTTSQGRGSYGGNAVCVYDVTLPK